MKFSVFGIVKAHLLTLREADSNSISYWDIFQFYIVPFACAFLPLMLKVRLTEDFYSVSVSIFSIFSALLLSVQVALYSILRDAKSLPHDPIQKEIEKEKRIQERILLRELNANISYLILLSCIGVTAFLIFFSVDNFETIQSSFSFSFMYTFF